MDCSFGAETHFGPSVAICRRSFDFTLLFEEIVFQLVPSCAFVLGAAVRLLQLAKSPTVVKQGALHALKLITTTAFAILNLATLVLVCAESMESTFLAVPAAALLFVASLSLALVSHYEHFRSRRPSHFITIYLWITILLRASCVRTSWLMNRGSHLSAIEISTVLVQVIIIVLESWSKENRLIEQGTKISTEETAGFMSRSLFLWLYRVLFTGYRRSLTPLDLQPIDTELRTSNLTHTFASILHANYFGSAGLSGLALRSLKLPMLYPILPRLCLTGFTFAQPFVTSSVIAYLANSKSRPENNGYGLIVASCLVYIGIALANSWYWHLAYKSVVMMRGGLVDSVFEKTLKLPQDKDSEAMALTLMIADVQRIMSALTWVHELWAAPLEAGLATWLLWRQVGYSSFTVLGLCFVCTIISTLVGKSSGTQQGVWLKATQIRIAATKKILSSLKAIKMTGMEQKASDSLEALRSLEFEASNRFRSLMVGGVVSSYITLTLSPVLVFGTYLGAANSGKVEFDASRLFTSLILITLLASPLIRILQILPVFGAARACFSRLQGFLEKRERVDARALHKSCSKEGSLATGTAAEVLIDDASENDEKYVPYSSIAVQIRDADLGWDAQTCLKKVNLEISKGEHIVITGPVGCGKSLLLQAILGETSPTHGSVWLGTSNIGFCGQTPWLENISVLGNAFRCAPADEKWHHTVIEACALKEVLFSHPGDEIIGSGGVRISGGERQRLALARTLAFRPSIVLLDDVFSAIDRTTEKHITERLFGKTGIFRQLGTTVIQVVQDKQRATMADKVFEINGKGHLHRCEHEVSEQEGSRASDSPDAEVPAPNVDPSKLPAKDAVAGALGISDRAVYRAYFASIGRAHVTLFLVAGAAFVFTLKFPDIWVQWWSNASSTSSSRSTGYWLGLYALFQVLPLFALGAWFGHLLLQIVPRSGLGLHRILLKTLMNATFSFISTIDTGSLLNRFNQDLNLVDMKLPIDLFNTAAEGLTCVVQVVLVVVASLVALAVIPVLCSILYLLQHFYLRTSKQLRQLDLESKSGLHTKISETFAGLITIRAHGLQYTLRDEFEEKLDRSQEPIYLLYMVQRWLQLTLNLIVAGLSVTVVGVAVGRSSSTTTGAIGLAFLNLTTLGETMTNFIVSWTSMETSLGAISRIKSFEKNTPSEANVPSPIIPPLDWPQAGSIKFEKVYTTYNANVEKPTWSLQNLSFEIRAGERVAICGRTGSGKSTLLMSLLALIKAHKGSITIDGIDISRVEHATLRSRMHVISQDPYEQGNTIRDALDSSGVLVDEVVHDVLSECAILEKVNNSGGLSASMEAANFSVGEAQLFALARIILQGGSRPSGILLLDEATSSIDVETEKKVMKVVSEKLPGMTVVAVMHRLEIALEYDQILLLENGELVHSGTPSQVMQASELFSALR